MDSIAIDNLAESSITSSLVVCECSLLDTGCEMKAFLYDYINDNTTVDNERSAIILFGYTESRQKCEIVLTGFEIYCDIAADFDFFTTY